MSKRTIFVCDACLREVPAQDPWHTPEKWSTIDFSGLGADGRIKRDLLACSQKCTGTVLRQLLKDVEAPRQRAPLEPAAAPLEAVAPVKPVRRKRKAKRPKDAAG